jgi:hypothetical protein
MTFPVSFPLYARMLMFGAIREASMPSGNVKVFPKCISCLEVTAVGRIADLTRLLVDPVSNLAHSDPCRAQI